MLDASGVAEGRIPGLANGTRHKTGALEWPVLIICSVSDSSKLAALGDSAPRRLLAAAA